MCTCVCVALWLFLFTRLLFLFVPLLFFQPFQMSSSEFHERLKSKALCDFRLGTVATSDHETPLTGCTFNLYSIINNGLLPGGQNLSRRQTVFFLPVDPKNEDHKDPEYIHYSAPRLARYLQNAWKRHQDTVFGRY